MPEIVNSSIYQFSQQMKKIFGVHLSKVIVYVSDKQCKGDFRYC